MLTANLKSQLKLSSDKSTSKYAELAAAIVALASASVVFLFFMDTHGDPTNPNKIYIFIKQGYSSWAWGTFSFSSMLYYFIRSNKTTISGGYMSPFLKWILELLKIIPFLALILSLSSSTNFVLQNHLWNSTLRISNNFLDTILIFFVATHLGAGIGGILHFFTRKSANI